VSTAARVLARDRPQNVAMASDDLDDLDDGRGHRDRGEETAEHHDERDGSEQQESWIQLVHGLVAAQYNGRREDARYAIPMLVVMVHIPLLPVSSPSRQYTQQFAGLIATACQRASQEPLKNPFSQTFQGH
jgi:hypothetical protein